MRTYFFLLVISAAACFVFSRRLAEIAQKRNWARRDDGRDGAGVPRLGGVAMFAASLFALALLLLWDNDVTRRLTADPQLGRGLLAAVSCVFLLGLYDDLRGARPWQKLAVQATAGCILFFSGYRVDLLTNPLSGGSFTLGWFALPITLIWLIAISNAFNLIDGLDGLAAGVGLFSAIALFLLALTTQNPFMAAIAAVLAGALLGFLPNNFAPARIYLGDCGSLTAGLTLAALAVRSSQKGPVIITMAIPLMVFGLPLLDAGVTTVRRFLSGHPIFSRDEEHLHHRLLKIGLTHRAAVLLLYGVAAFFALSSLLLVNYKSSAAPLIALLCGMLAWLVVRQMDYAEFSELDSHFRTALATQRTVLRNHIHLRKAARELPSAQGIDAAWEIASRAFTLLEFDAAECNLTHGPGHGSVTLRWNNPAHPAVMESDGRRWSMVIPLRHEQRVLGSLELARNVERGTILFRTAALMDFLQAFSARIVALSAEQAEDFAAERKSA